MEVTSSDPRKQDKIRTTGSWRSMAPTRGLHKTVSTRSKTQGRPKVVPQMVEKGATGHSSSPCSTGRAKETGSSVLGMAYPCRLKCVDLTFDSLLQAYCYITLKTRGYEEMAAWLKAAGTENFLKNRSRLESESIKPCYPEETNRKHEKILLDLLWLKKAQCQDFDRHLSSVNAEILAIACKLPDFYLPVGLEMYVKCLMKVSKDENQRNPIVHPEILLACKTAFHRDLKNSSRVLVITDKIFGIEGTFDTSVVKLDSFELSPSTIETFWDPLLSIPANKYGVIVLLPSFAGWTADVDPGMVSNRLCAALKKVRNSWGWKSRVILADDFSFNSNEARLPSHLRSRLCDLDSLRLLNIFSRAGTKLPATYDFGSGEHGISQQGLLHVLLAFAESLPFGNLRLQTPDKGARSIDLSGASTSTAEAPEDNTPPPRTYHADRSSYASNQLECAVRHGFESSTLPTLEEDPTTTISSFEDQAQTSVHSIASPPDLCTSSIGSSSSDSLSSSSSIEHRLLTTEDQIEETDATPDADEAAGGVATAGAVKTMEDPGGGRGSPDILDSVSAKIASLERLLGLNSPSLPREPCDPPAALACSPGGTNGVLPRPDNIAAGRTSSVMRSNAGSGLTLDLPGGNPSLPEAFFHSECEQLSLDEVEPHLVDPRPFSDSPSIECPCGKVHETRSPSPTASAVLPGTRHQDEKEDSELTTDHYDYQFGKMRMDTFHMANTVVRKRRIRTASRTRPPVRDWDLGKDRSRRARGRTRSDNESDFDHNRIPTPPVEPRKRRVFNMISGMSTVEISAEQRSADFGTNNSADVFGSEWSDSASDDDSVKLLKENPSGGIESPRREPGRSSSAYWGRERSDHGYQNLDSSPPDSERSDSRQNCNTRPLPPYRDFELRRDPCKKTLNLGGNCDNPSPLEPLLPSTVADSPKITPTPTAVPGSFGINMPWRYDGSKRINVDPQSRSPCSSDCIPLPKKMKSCSTQTTTWIQDDPVGRPSYRPTVRRLCDHCAFGEVFEPGTPGYIHRCYPRRSGYGVTPPLHVIKQALQSMIQSEAPKGN